VGNKSIGMLLAMWWYAFTRKLEQEIAETGIGD